MKQLLLCFTILAMCFDAFGVAAPESTSLATEAYQSKDSSLLKPSDVAYVEAMELARFLNEKGISVKTVHRSHFESFFRGIEKAAFFRTDRGVFEVIFFPDPKGAEKVQVMEQPGNGRYLYTFRGQPQPNLPGDTIDAGRPTYFITRGNLFMVTISKELYDLLMHALMEG
jgi:hypothetical protein